LLHADVTGSGVPAPLPPYALVANCNIALTPYTEPDDGGLAIVPGSHKWCRHPLPHETDVVKNKQVVPVLVPKGSAIIWHGNTFHGAYERKKPGFRINLSQYFNRRFITTQEEYGKAVPKEMLDRNNERFAQLMGINVKHIVPDGEEYADLREVATGAVISRSQYS